MREVEQDTREYFAAHPRSYWHWLENGSVAVWSDGTTIAFREELLGVMERVAPQGLPPLGSILLLLAACRENWNKSARRAAVQAHWNGFSRIDMGHAFHALLQEVLDGLDKVHAARHLVQDWLSHKATLAGWLFENAPGRFAPAESQTIFNRLRLGLAASELEGRTVNPFNDIVHDLGCLRWGIKLFSEHGLASMLGTGLETAILPAPVKPPPPTTARDLIASLQDDPELGSVARLANLLLAAINLPRALSDPEQLPVGGVSDISNRGPLDRLLLSELANEDLTLTVRLAMNEALFLRRESPPRTPPRRRRVLLDAGLRTWGVPRVFVAAVGLALAAKSDANISVQAYRAEKDGAVPIKLDTDAGLREHLGALDPNLHPARSVQALLEEDEPEEMETDLVLVTTDDTLADADFQRDLYEAKLPPLYIATVGRDGKFELTQRSSRGSKVISRAQFDLDEVLAPRPGAKPLHEPQEFLPAFFAQAKVPLRLSHPVDPQRSWFVHPGMVVTYTRDGRLLLWNNPGHGAVTLREKLPAGELHWCSSILDGDMLRLVVGRKSKTGLYALTHHRDAGEVEAVRLHLDMDQPLEVVGGRGYALVFGRDQIEAVSLKTGEHLAGGTFAEVLGRPVPSYRQGRFFARGSGDGHREWLAVAYNPAADPKYGIVSERFFKETARTQLIAVSEMDWGVGPLGLTSKGELLDPIKGLTTPSGELVKRLRSPFGLIGLSRDGRRAIVSCFAGQPGASSIHEVLWDLDLQHMRDLRYLIKGKQGDSLANQSRLEAPVNEIARPRPLHAKYRGLAVTEENQLVLISRKGQYWPIEFFPNTKEFRLPRQPLFNNQALRVRTKQFFADFEHSDAGYSLEIARFADGSRVWLDGRGLLHLRSSRSDLPECTLVLTDGPLAGWLSDGRIFGPQYWLGEKKQTSEMQAQVEVLLPFAKELA